MEPFSPQVVVILVPLPCQSHLNQLLHLATAIAAHGLPVHYLGTSTHNRQARLRWSQSHSQISDSLSQIQFHDLHTSPIASPEPDPYASDRTPMHLAPASIAYMSLAKPMASYVHELSSQARRIVVIYDRMLAETARDAIILPKVEGYAFNCLSAFDLLHILWEHVGKPFRIPEVVKSLPPIKELIPGPGFEFIVSTSVSERTGDIHNTIRLIERDYINMFSREEISGKNKQQWALRPILTATKSDNKPSNHSRHKCLEWLDRQDPGSVIYISFGTTTSLREEEVKEIATGLEQSKQKFLWVLRDADRADIFVQGIRTINLPQGFEERVGDGGMVVREWVPQMEILGHESTGGFMSHCGWNSCLESVAAGVAMAAWPMHSDQVLNAAFLREVLKVGIEVRDWGKREEVVTAEVVKEAVERLMASEEGEAVRRRAAELGREIRTAAEEGGEDYEEMNKYIHYITR